MLSGLVRTVNFVHQHGYLHNDIQNLNTLLHIVDVNDDIYVGLMDRGHSSLNGTHKCYRPTMSAEKANTKMSYKVILMLLLNTLV